ncbi:MAG: hypothetical protein ABI277_03635, partial [Burkholderiaceae bacterium]
MTTRPSPTIGDPQTSEAGPTGRVASDPLTPELLHGIDAYWRAANYLSVGQIYLADNPLLKRPLAVT